jgi:hypothetical protein
VFLFEGILERRVLCSLTDFTAAKMGTINIRFPKHSLKRGKPLQLSKYAALIPDA